MCLMVLLQSQVFLTLFGASGYNSIQEGNRNTTRQRGTHEKEKDKRERMSVRLVVSQHTVAPGQTANNILTTVLITSKAVICAE